MLGRRNSSLCERGQTAPQGVIGVCGAALTQDAGDSRVSVSHYLSSACCSIYKLPFGHQSNRHAHANAGSASRRHITARLDRYSLTARPTRAESGWFRMIRRHETRRARYVRPICGWRDGPRFSDLCSFTARATCSVVWYAKCSSRQEHYATCLNCSLRPEGDSLWRSPHSPHGCAVIGLPRNLKSDHDRNAVQSRQASSTSVAGAGIGAHRMRADYFTRRHTVRAARRHVRQLDALRFHVTIEKAA